VMPRVACDVSAHTYPAPPYSHHDATLGPLHTNYTWLLRSHNQW